MFPERQSGPHRDWKEEVGYLDSHFSNGAAYTVGKMNGDHWLLYMTNPPDQPAPSLPASVPTHSDYTIEILMSGLQAPAREPFFNDDLAESGDPSSHAQALSEKIGISSIFPPHLTTLDAYSFVPCGYSSNALIKWGEQDNSGEGYHTIHVTPEEGWSYASFECNVPLTIKHSPSSVQAKKEIPTIQELVRRVVAIFQPTRLSLTLFISAEDNEASESEAGASAVELAQRAFKSALEETPFTPTSSSPVKYRRTDKINYEFGGYDLAFASFELK